MDSTFRYKNLFIQKPCHENWQAMDATERGRFCQSCKKEVIDFTNKTEQEFNEIIASGKASGCGRFFTNQIGRPPQVAPISDPKPLFRLPWQKGTAAAWLLLTLWQLPQTSKAAPHNEIACSTLIHRKSGPFDLRLATGNNNYISGKLIDQTGRRLLDNVEVTVTLPDGNVKSIKTKKGKFGIQLRHAPLPTDTIHFEMAHQQFETADSHRTYQAFSSDFTVSNCRVIQLWTEIRMITLGNYSSVPTTSLNFPAQHPPIVNNLPFHNHVPDVQEALTTETSIPHDEPSTPTPRDDSGLGLTAILPERWRNPRRL